MKVFIYLCIADFGYSNLTFINMDPLLLIRSIRLGRYLFSQIEIANKKMSLA